jgi:hypothetical protein
MDISNNKETTAAWFTFYSKNQGITTKRVQKLAVETAVKAMQEQGYDNLPKYNYLFEFGDGTLSAIDKYK